MGVYGFSFSLIQITGVWWIFNGLDWLGKFGWSHGTTLFLEGIRLHVHDHRGVKRKTKKEKWRVLTHPFPSKLIHSGDSNPSLKSSISV